MEIEESIKSLISLVDRVDGTNKGVYERIRIRLVHIMGRVKCMPQDVNDEVTGYRGDQLIILKDEIEEIKDRHSRQ